MIIVSSPVTHPSSPPAKRAKPPDHGSCGGKRRLISGFIIDDDSDDDSDDGHCPVEPALKKRMLELPPRTAQPIAPDDSNPPLSHYGAAVAAVAAPAAAPAAGTPGARASPRKNHTGHESKLPSVPTTLMLLDRERTSYRVTTCSGETTTVKVRKPSTLQSYQDMVAARSRTRDGRATRAYYGIEIHQLLDAAKKATAARIATTTAPSGRDQPATRTLPPPPLPHQTGYTQLWTEKYRARSFMDLCGDNGTNRLVLRWLKRWDPIVFPGTAAARARHFARRAATGQMAAQQAAEERPLRKILMLAGPPGLGKTTLAHVCARQAGYDVLEINASDDRSANVVQNRIRTSLGTESVKSVAGGGGGGSGPRPVASPVCVVVDEVDGAVSGSAGSGEGGFVRALIDLVLLDQKNDGVSLQGQGSVPGRGGAAARRRKRTDTFRLRRPLILICNDIYHPSLRPLRQSGLAEIVHAGRPSLDAVVVRLQSVFNREGLPCDKDAARKLCEATWGLATGAESRRVTNGAMEGDLRSVMVAAEWVAGRFRAAAAGIVGGPSLRLTRQWLEDNVAQGLVGGGGGARGLGRGGSRDIVSRIFREGGGFPASAAAAAAATGPGGDGGDEEGEGGEIRSHTNEQPRARLGFSEPQKRHTIERLRQMIETCGEVDRVVADVFMEYPDREFNDDGFLSKPDSAYEWIHFHDACTSRMYGGQDWELTPYLSQAALACHLLFASPRHFAAGTAAAAAAADPDAPPAPFSGPRADYDAREAERQNRAQLQAIQSRLPPTLGRAFRSAESVAVDLIPYLTRIVSPDVKPVVVGGQGSSFDTTVSVRKAGERAMVTRAAEVLAEVGVSLQRGRIEPDDGPGGGGRPQFVYRMEPDIDALATFETASATLLSAQAPTRYAVRQVLDLELKRVLALRDAASRQSRLRGGDPTETTPGGELLQQQRQSHHLKLLSAPAGAKEEKVKRDFFGRVVVDRPRLKGEGGGGGGKETNTVWVTYHEGLNNAVKKPISLQEFLRGL